MSIKVAMPDDDDRQMSAFEKIVQRAIAEKKPMGLDTDPIRLACPQLWKWLTEIAAGDSHVKTPPQVRIQLTPGGVGAQVVDPDLGYALPVAVEHLDQIWLEAERLLTLTNPPIIRFGKRAVNLRKRRND